MEKRKGQQRDSPEFIILLRVLASLSSLPAREELLRWHLARGASQQTSSLSRDQWNTFKNVQEVFSF